MIIQQAMCKTALFFINQALKLDGDYQTLLKPIVGKVLTVTVTPLNWSYSVYILKDKIDLEPVCDHAADVSLEGSLWDLLSLCMTSSPQAVLAKGAIKQTGDVEVLSKIQRVLLQLEIDWQGLLARFFGDSIAKTMADKIRRAQDAMKHNVDAVKEDAKQWARAQSLSPSKSQMEKHSLDIIQLKEAIDRLEAKIILLEG